MHVLILAKFTELDEIFLNFSMAPMLTQEKHAICFTEFVECGKFDQLFPLF